MSGAEVHPSSAKFGPVKTAAGDQCHILSLQRHQRQGGSEPPSARYGMNAVL